MEVILTCFGAGAFRADRVGFEEAFCAPLCRTRCEPQDRLQMAAALSCRWCGRFGRSVASAAPRSASKAGALEALRGTGAPGASLLGRQKNPRSLAPVASSRPAAGGAHHRPLVARAGASGCPSPPRALRSLVPHPGLTVPRRRHQVWTVDFKGWFRTADGQRQEPLTVREAKSRYLLEIRLLPQQSDHAVRRVLTRLFRRHGLPSAIRVDNGAPFGGKGALGLSRLSLWWLRLGIRVEFTRRARPGDNAAHEQLHRCYKAEVLAPPAGHRHAQQRRTDRWRYDYNHRRPHEALGQKPPGRTYRASTRPWPQTLPALRYPKNWLQRRVRPHGDIKWQGRLRFVGRAFVGQTLGLKTLTPHGWAAVHLGPLLIGELHAKDAAGMRPARWQRLPHHPLKL